MCAEQKNASEPESPQRRTFLIILITAMGSFISFILGGSGLYYFLSPAWRGPKGRLGGSRHGGQRTGGRARQIGLRQTQERWLGSH